MLAPVSLIQLTRLSFVVEKGGPILRNHVELVLHVAHLKLLKNSTMLFHNLGYALQSQWRYLVDVLSIKGVWLSQERGGAGGCMETFKEC